MKLAKHEQKALAKHAGHPIRQQITDYPGRVVTVQQAHDRIRKLGRSLHDACTVPIDKRYQRGSGTYKHDAPGFKRDLKAGMGAWALRKKWGVGYNKVMELRDETIRKG